MQPLSGVLSVAGPVIQGVGLYKSGQAADAAARAQAREEELAAAADIARIREDARRTIGTQAAALWSSGFTGDSGTALDALRESQINAALDVMARRRQGDSAARSLRAEGALRASEGRWGLASGLLSGATGYERQRIDWAQARQGTSAANGGGGVGG